MFRDVIDERLQRNHGQKLDLPTIRHVSHNSTAERLRGMGPMDEHETDLDTDDTNDEYLPHPDEIADATDRIRQNWTAEDHASRRRTNPSPIETPAAVRAMAERQLADRMSQWYRHIETDPIPWIEQQISKIEFAVRAGEFGRVREMVNEIQQHGHDYRPPKAVTTDSWISEIFDQHKFVELLGRHGITKARHLLAISPATLKKITINADAVIAVMRRHFGPGTNHQPAKPAPSSGTVDWMAYSPEPDPIDEYGEILAIEEHRAKQLARAC
jgi:hypothetical protein